MSRVAVIDLGTNTFHLLIAEVSHNQITILYKEKSPVKIGEGGLEKGIITNTALNRGIETLKHFAEILKKFKVEKCKAVGTSAFRNAQNKEDVLKSILDQTSIEIDVISGEEEAQLIFEGVKRAVKLESDLTYLIMDIGGGSVEFILCKEEELLWKHSFEIGGQRLMKRFHQTDPISQDNIDALKNYVSNVTEPLKEVIKKYEPSILIGASGTFDTLVEIYHKKNNMVFALDDNTEYKLPLSDFKRIHQEIAQKNYQERLKIDGMIAMRADMIVVATTLIEYLISTFNFQMIKTSTYALKEGVLRRLFNEVNAQ